MTRPGYFRDEVDKAKALLAAQGVVMTPKRRGEVFVITLTVGIIVLMALALWVNFN